MDAERWRQISRLYHAADALAENDRHAFLTGACQGGSSFRADRFATASAIFAALPANSYQMEPIEHRRARLIRNVSWTVFFNEGVRVVLRLVHWDSPVTTMTSDKESVPCHWSLAAD